MKNIIYVEGLDDESQDVFKYFLSFYQDSSAPSYSNAFRHICKHTGKSSIKKWTLEDYRSCRDNEINACVSQIFKFLYAHGILDSSSDFETEFGNKEPIQKRFDKILDMTKKEKDSSYTPGLSAEELDKLINFVESVEEGNFDDMKLAFCFYMLFFQQIDVGQLGQLDAKDYIERKIGFEEGEIEIPVRFHLFLEDLKKKTKSKFTAVNKYIADLGNKVGINDLNPTDIVQARKQRELKCPECGIQYPATVENWVSVNTYLMCKGCFDKLNKSEQVKKSN